VDALGIVRGFLMNIWRERVFYVAVLVSILSTPAQAQLGSFGCQRAMIAMGVSPDDKWVAIVQEEVCIDNTFGPNG
jgi:hypothetical protein